MICNNAKTEYIDGRYRLTMPPDKQAEKDEVLKQAVEKYNGYCHVEISKVRKPRSIEANALFHSLLSEYYISGCHSSITWDDLKITLKYRYGVVKQYEVDGNTLTDVVSTSKYNTAEFSPLIDGTIKEMLLTGVSSKKFTEILEGINYDG